MSRNVGFGENKTPEESLAQRIFEVLGIGGHLNTGSQSKMA